MKFLVIFAAVLVCVHAVHLPYIVSSDSKSSEEEYRILLPAKDQQQPLISLPGVGVITQPVVQAVKVKVPRDEKPEVKQQIIQEELAERGYGAHSVAAASNDVPQQNVAAYKVSKLVVD